ncbi:MAG: TetR/AcrR family transcriptional regulator [Actinobacteria bacterium]|nr:TetR/AcrR family transcriptional regulator [Actinomycetota bacterium]
MSRHLGRPRDRQLDDAILDAVAELLPERGYTRTTIDAVIARAGTTKTAFYRRYADLADVVGALLARRYGLDSDIDTGSLVMDLQCIQERQGRLFHDPLVTRGMLGFLETVQLDADRAGAFLNEFLRPRRLVTKDVIERAYRRGEIPALVDHEWICDLITGPLFFRAMLPGLAPIDDAFLANTVEAALKALAYTAR